MKEMNEEMKVEMMYESSENGQVCLKEEKKHFSKLGLMYFLGTLIIFAVQLGAGAVLGNFFPTLMSNVDVAFLSAMLPMYAIGMPLMMLLICRVPGRQAEQHKMSVGQVIVAFIMCYAIVYVSNIVGNIITVIIGAVKGGEVVNTIAVATTSVSPWVSVLTMVLLAPVMEEILFRKLLLDRTVKYGQGVAIMLSAVMFGCFHGNLNQFAYAFTLGLFLAFVYVKTGKVIYTVILHIAINFVGSVLSVWVLEKADLHAMTEAVNASPEAVAAMLPNVLLLLGYFAVLFVLVITGAVLLIVKKKKFTVEAGEVTLPKGKRFSTVIVNVGMLLYVIFWIVMIIGQLFL